MANQISEVTRQEIIDILTVGFKDEESEEFINCYWSGRLTDMDFLSRLYDLNKIESKDARYKNAYDDIRQHRVNNNDWEDDWVFYDSRFGIKNVDDDEFLRFLSEVFHPAVRNERSNWQTALRIINKLLKIDGFELYEKEQLSGRSVYSYKKYNEKNINLLKDTTVKIDLKMVGQGSYAIVYKYKDPQYNKFFALKRAKKELDDKEIERFKREYSVLKELKSPYIIEVYSYNENQNEYIMEYMDDNLYNYIAQNNSKISMQERKGYVIQFLKGIKYIHGKDKLHRDINPKNILIKLYEDINVIKLSDFGLVKIDDSNLTSLDTNFKGWFNDPNLRLIGFSNYELCHEIYAITMTIYYILTGKTNVAEIRNKNLNYFIKKGLNPDISKRYKSVGEIIIEFNKINFEEEQTL